MEKNYFGNKILKVSILAQHKGFQSGEAPHREFHKVYVSSNLIESLAIKNRIASHGKRII
ncbi:MAG: hypothetical protein DRP84_05605 [Spirochaetes bacterium]|nr:MAG: hypothetical protein DRP84_05605 [Spirochaetota bacterium]